MAKGDLVWDGGVEVPDRSDSLLAVLPLQPSTGSGCHPGPLSVWELCGCCSSPAQGDVSALGTTVKGTILATTKHLPGQPQRTSQTSPFPPAHACSPCSPQHRPPSSSRSVGGGCALLGAMQQHPMDPPTHQDQGLSGCPTAPQQPELSPSPWG